MEDVSSYGSGDLVTVSFVDEKGFDCNIEGKVVKVFDDSIVCEPTDMDSVTRFRVSFVDEVVKLLLGDEFEDSIVSYSVGEVSREEESDLEDFLNQIDEDEFEGIDQSYNGSTNGKDLFERDIGGNHYYCEKEFDSTGQQQFSSLDKEEDETYIYAQAR